MSKKRIIKNILQIQVKYRILRKMNLFFALIYRLKHISQH